MNLLVELFLAGLAAGSIYALLASGFVLVFKCTRVFNLAYPSLVLIGIYIAYSLSVYANFPPWLAVACSMVVGFGLGFVIEKLFLRPMIGEPLISVLLLTIGLSEVLKGMAGIIWGTQERSFPQLFPAGQLVLGNYNVPQFYLWLSGTGLAVFALLALFYKKAPLGIMMRAVATQQDWASLMGINPKRIFALSWALAAALGSLAGAFLATMVSVNLYLEPFVLKAFPAAVLGGMDSIPGALVGGLVIGVVESLIGGLVDPILGGGAKEIVAFIILILVLMVKPYGFFGTEEIERL